MKFFLTILGLSLIGVISASGLIGYDGWKQGWNSYPGSLYGSNTLGWKGTYGGGWNYGSGLGWKGWNNYKHIPLTGYGYGGYGLGGLDNGYGLGYGLGQGSLDPWC